MLPPLATWRSSFGLYSAKLKKLIPVSNCKPLLSDCNSEKQTSNVFVDSLFEVFYDRVPSGENHSQQMIISNNNNSSMDITTSKPSLVPSSSPDLRTSTPNTHRNLRASSVQRQSDTLRSLAKKRDVAQHLHATPPTSLEGSSLHSRSRTGSPCPSTTCGEYSVSKVNKRSPYV